MRTTNTAICILSLLAVMSLGSASGVLANDKPDPTVIGEGKSDFDWQCTSCHGDSGKGDGPMAKMLIKQPSDLTVIAKNNDGTFPFWRIFRIIAGKSAVAGHETFQMPDFWRRFRGNEKEWGFLPPHVRVLELTHYVESIQEK